MNISIGHRRIKHWTCTR